MEKSRSCTLVGVFRDRPQAERALRELRRAGFRGGQTGLTTGPGPALAGDAWKATGANASEAVAQLLGGTAAGRRGKRLSRTLSGEETGVLVEEGAVTGGVTGGTVAGLLGAAAVATGLIPGVGPVLAGGLAAGLLGTAAAGVAAGGLVGGLVGAGIAEREAQFYEQEWAAGYSLVAVRVRSRSREAAGILRRCGGYDAHKRRPKG